MAPNEDEEIPGQVSPPPPPPAVVTTQPRAREVEEAGGGAAVGPGGDNMEGDPVRCFYNLSVFCGKHVLCLEFRARP